MPKIIGATLGEHRQKTQQALFEALSELLRENPFEQITMAQIARRAGVGRTAIYNHFEDKESLLFALMSSAAEDFARVLLEALQVVDDPLQKLRVYIRAQLELKKQFHVAVSLNMRNASQPQSKLREHAKIVQRVMHNLVNEAYQAGQLSQPSTPHTLHLIQASLAGQDLPDARNERAQVEEETEAFILRALGANEDDVAFVDPRVSELEFVFDYAAAARSKAEGHATGEGQGSSRGHVTGNAHGSAVGHGTGQRRTSGEMHAVSEGRSTGNGSSGQPASTRSSHSHITRGMCPVAHG